METNFRLVVVIYDMESEVDGLGGIAGDRSVRSKNEMCYKLTQD
jgi:hypothetical protein